MKKLILLLFATLAVASINPIGLTFASHISAEELDRGEFSKKEVSPNGKPHNWKKTSSEFEMVHADTHEYTVWHNFIKKTRKCDITHRMQTEVWYCDVHNHTKSEVSLEETIHSNRHS